ncbi:MAG: hypothetical protein H0V29_05065 [Thermoleophilaceae bacterium]|nr:hypothetical protein [Thermoleophilaceae bacterium]
MIGGFAVIAHRHVRATQDSDFLIPADEANDRLVVAGLRALSAERARDGAGLDLEMLSGADHVRVLTDGGLVDLVREGVPPLDFESVAAGAVRADFETGPFLVAGLAALVGFKRLAGRPQDRRDLEALEEIHGDLPVEPIPGLDD